MYDHNFFVIRSQKGVIGSTLQQPFPYILRTAENKILKTKRKFQKQCLTKSAQNNMVNNLQP